MTDLFDQQITDGLHRAVDGIAVPRGSFGDVRRRARARRIRHVAVVVVPALAGMVWIGMRPSGDPDPLAAGTATDSTTGSSEPAPNTAVTSSYPAVNDDVWADQVARSATVFEALGFPAGERAVGENDSVSVHAVDPAHPKEREITLTIHTGAPEVFTASTMSSTEHDGRIVVVRQASDGWLYELEVIDTAGAGLPTVDQIYQLLVTTFG